MVLIKRFAVCLWFCCIGSSSMGQDTLLQDTVYKDCLQRIQRLEKSRSDSLQYGKELFSFAKYCRKLGMYEQSKLTAELSATIFEKKLERIKQQENRNTICRNLIIINDFIGDLSSARKGNLFYESMIPYVSSVQYTAELFTNAMELGVKGLESGDKSLIASAMKLLESIPKNFDPKSMYQWESGDISGAVNTLAKALEDDAKAPFMTAVQREKMKRRLEALTLLVKSSKKNVGACLQMAENMYYPTTVSQVLYDQRLPDYFLMFRHSAILFEKYNQPANVLKVYHRIKTLLTDLMDNELPYLLPTERTLLWQMVESYFREMQAVACKHQRVDGMAELMYDINLWRKELFTVASYRLQEHLALEKNHYIIKLQEQIDAFSYGENAFKKHTENDYIRKLENDVMIMNLRRMQVEYLKKNTKIDPQWHYQWKDVVALLSPQDAVIEFISLPTSLLSRTYLAIVFTGRNKTPQFVSLGDNIYWWRWDQDKFYKKFWKPLAKHLEGCTNIYLSPDGELNDLPFAQLYDGKKYLCEKYVLHNMFSTGDIVSAKSQKPQPQNYKRDIFFFGGAEFGLPLEQAAANRGQGFAYLPGTVKEIDDISKILSREWNIHKFIGAEATEYAFKNLSYKLFSSAVIHISTHGFNLPYDRSIQSNAINYNGKSGYDEPLMRSGFVLSGANDAWNHERPMGGKEDGIVTALEVSLLCLANTDLVVLSACDTGLGEIKDGEGVFGLQRAFRLAGAKSLLVSLWKVSDKETAELMTDFYRLWQSGKSKQEAFTLAQRSMKDKYPDEPKKWAGFILIE